MEGVNDSSSKDANRTLHEEILRMRLVLNDGDDEFSEDEQSGTANHSQASEIESHHELLHSLKGESL